MLKIDENDQNAYVNIFQKTIDTLWAISRPNIMDVNKILQKPPSF